MGGYVEPLFEGRNDKGGDGMGGVSAKKCAEML